MTDKKWQLDPKLLAEMQAEHNCDVPRTALSRRSNIVLVDHFAGRGPATRAGTLYGL
jgi:hypothetical protein